RSLFGPVTPESWLAGPTNHLGGKMANQKCVRWRIVCEVIIAAIAALLMSTPAFAQTISASPSSLNFGSVSVGVSGIAHLSLFNSSSSTIVLYKFSVSGSGFSLVGIPATITLGPTQTAGFNVVFAPTTSGTVTGVITMMSTAFDSPTTVMVTGSGMSTTTS